MAEIELRRILIWELVLERNRCIPIRAEEKAELNRQTFIGEKKEIKAFFFPDSIYLIILSRKQGNVFLMSWESKFRKLRLNNFLWRRHFEESDRDIIHDKIIAE